MLTHTCDNEQHAVSILDRNGTLQQLENENECRHDDVRIHVICDDHA